MLIGRSRELRQIDEVLECARQGNCAALVLIGDAGIGKTALLEYAAGEADDFRIAHVRGVESEAELSFTGLFDVCRPLLPLLDRLEPLQADLLRGAFGAGEAHAVSTFAIGAATLSLLAAAAEEQPLLLVIDDAHWLDRSSADVLAFAVRRLEADAVATLVAMRAAEGRPFAARDLPELVLDGLDHESAAALLDAAGAQLAPGEREATLELATGNPLALIELAREKPEQYLPTAPMRVGARLERAFSARSHALPEETRRALVVATVMDAPELDLLEASLHRLDLPLACLGPAESAGLIALGAGELRFRHPLVRSAIYYSADPTERRSAHAAVASAFGDDERSAWHLAAAAIGTDEKAAGALERFAETAHRRAGFAAAAAAFERAAWLSQRRPDRVRRLSAAADAAWLGGRTSDAVALVDQALSHADDQKSNGELLHLRGTIEHFVGDAAHAHRTLEEAARLLVRVDPRQACLSLTEAVGSALFTGEIDRAVSLGGQAIAMADSEELDQRLFAFVPRGASLLLAGRPEEGLPFLRQAADAAGEALDDDPRNLTWAALAGWFLGDGALMVRKAGGAVEWARTHAAIAALPWADTLLGMGLIIGGRWREARAALLEAAEAARLTSQEGHLVMALSPLAWLDAAQGRAVECRAHVHEGFSISERLNLVWFYSWLFQALVVLELGLGIEPESRALKGLRQTLTDRPFRDPPAPPLSSWPNLIEALLRVDDVAAAESLFAGYAKEAEQLGEPLPRALVERCRGLHPDADDFDRHFDRALELHSSTENEFETARTRLAYGERLRRKGQRISAREQLHAALEVFERVEASPWVERTRAQLRASGERLRKSDAERDELTQQELQIALLVADGKTNREVGAQLFLSPKTVEWHLGHVYAKLGVRSRGQLARVLVARNTGTPDAVVT